MARFRAHVYITLKPTVNDPQGLTIQGALKQLGYEGVKSVRAGKYFVLELEALSSQEAEKSVEEMCRRLLANPVIEEFRFRIEGS